ncbi:SPOR domain-containing protein [Labilibaculum sp.]|uniref:SPOR domain-containing protein n=1 Tax=Labilibaculum sp. TaxID=2060723 RepID=UPI003561C12D
MRKHIRIVFIVSLILSLGVCACKDEAKAPVKKELTQKKESAKPEAKVIPKKKVAPVVKEVPNKYFLIIASFQNIENAKRFQKKLTNDGFTSEIFDGPNGFHRVSYKAFSDRALAFQELKLVRATEEHKDNWLYIKR